MLVELHIIQSFAPSNLNRDDTGAPKDCEFGGCRRARISSQCLKRAVRDQFPKGDLLSADLLAKRTKRLVDEVTSRLGKPGKDQAQSRAVIKAALQGLGLSTKEEDKTQYLLYLAENEIDAVTNLCLKHWDALLAASQKALSTKSDDTSKDKKKAGKETIPAEIVTALKGLLDRGKAADLALFGRMLADLPDKNVDAASQVAHAISTHKASVEFDYYTAVDDLKPHDTPGADMIGTVEFNSACFYRYANVDMEQLKKNLGGDEDLARRTLEAFLRASVAAIPTGKQNSTAAQNPPSFMFAVARNGGLWSLANAFLMPVHAQINEDLAQKSITALDGYWGKLTTMYGEKDILGKWLCALDGDGLANLKDAGGHKNKENKIVANTLDDVVNGVKGAVKFTPKN